MASVAMVLAQYPDDVIVFITDPRTGVQRHSKWPPTVAEIIEACDRRMQDVARRNRFENWGKTLAIEPPRGERPTLDELKAKYGDNWGLSPEPKKEVEKAPSWESIAAYYQANPDAIRRLTRNESSGEQT